MLTRDRQSLFNILLPFLQGHKRHVRIKNKKLNNKKEIGRRCSHLALPHSLSASSDCCSVDHSKRGHTWKERIFSILKHHCVNDLRVTYWSHVLMLYAIWPSGLAATVSFCSKAWWYMDLEKSHFCFFTHHTLYFQVALLTCHCLETWGRQRS